jgi:hypothetical protein
MSFSRSSILGSGPSASRRLLAVFPIANDCAEGSHASRHPRSEETREFQNRSLKAIVAIKGFDFNLTILIFRLLRILKLLFEFVLILIAKVTCVDDVFPQFQLNALLVFKCNRAK